MFKLFPHGTLPLLAVFAFASPVRAAISESDLWFFTDFDGRTQLNGRAVTLKTSADGVAEGRYGKGCYFHRPIRNTLPPMRDFLAAKTNFTVTGGTFSADLAKGRVTLSGGSMTIAPQRDPLGFSWVRPEGGVTCSFYVRGAKGTKVTLTPSLSPTTPEAVKAVPKKCGKWGFNNVKQVSDRVIATTNVLDGAWQRIWAGVRHDNRTTDGRFVTLKIDATGPIEMERFQYEQSSVYPYLGNFVPALWTDGGTSRESEAASIQDAALLGEFPAERGSASFWVRSISNDWSYANCRAFAFTDEPKLEYSFDGDLRTGSWGAHIVPPWKKRYQRSSAWQHVVVTWAPSNQCFYVDGVLRNETHFGYGAGEAKGRRRCLRIGTATNGSQPCDSILDEVAIFRRDLTAEEVAALAKREKGLLADSRTLLATEVNFPFFWRNQKDAALRCTVRAMADVDVRVEAEIGGKKLPAFDLKLVAGDNPLVVPFDPSRFRVGKYKWSVALKTCRRGVSPRQSENETSTTGRGETPRLQDTLLSRSGSLNIYPRFDREAPTYMSWGGNRSVPNDFMQISGLNAKNISANDLPGIRELVKCGIVPNIRYENSGKWQDYDFDMEAVERDTEKALAPFVGLFLWNQTLVNSEVYGTWVIHKAKKNPKFLALAEKAIGMKPDFTFGDAPSQVWWKELGLKKPSCVIGPTNATVETLHWCMNRGQPVYAINEANRRAIRRLSPGNVVWTEPIYGNGDIADDVDMMADWFYSYSVDDNLMAQRRCAGQLRGKNKPFMPTLSMYTDAPGRHPTRVGKDGKPEKVTMGQGLDELIVKTHVAIGATRADRLSMFSADSWCDGVKGCETYLLHSTNRISVICDQDAPRSYGDFVRKTAMPEIRLLRGLENVRAPVAFLEPSEPDIAGGHGWIHWHFVRAMRKAVASQPIPFDVLKDGETGDANALAKYRYLIFPMASVVTEAHAKALEEAEKRGATIVLDSYACDEICRRGVSPRQSENATSTSGRGETPRLQEKGGSVSVGRGETPRLQEKGGSVSVGRGETPRLQEKGGSVSVGRGETPRLQDKGRVKLESKYWNHPGWLSKTAGGPLLDWYTNKIDELKAILPSVSSCDGGEGYTFEKEGNGVRYVMVVNNKRAERSARGGVLIDFCTNSWYRPYGAPQRITTAIRKVAKEAGVYLFNGDQAEVDRKFSDVPELTLAADYGPAEAKVFVITPEPLEAPELEIEKGAAENVLHLKVRIETKSGKTAPNRTVLRVKVTDPDGRETDESGDYECAGGACEIPIRFADNDPEGGFFSKWKAEVTDLVTGESETLRFSR